MSEEIVGMSEGLVKTVTTDIEDDTPATVDDAVNALVEIHSVLVNLQKLVIVLDDRVEVLEKTREKKPVSTATTIGATVLFSVLLVCITVLILGLNN